MLAQTSAMGEAMRMQTARRRTSTRARVATAKPKPDVTAALRQAIIGGELMPNERLIELELAGRFGSNRVQVRAALSKLEGEGLHGTRRVRAHARQGAQVSPLLRNLPSKLSAICVPRYSTYVPQCKTLLHLPARPLVSPASSR